MTLTNAAVERDLAFAIHVAREAGERVLRLRESGRWQGDLLADIGDQSADGLLQGLIRGRYPDDGLLSEETVDDARRLSKSRTWIVDPLDGTREFSQGRSDWAVHVALTIDGACALGAVALPSEGCVLWGVSLPGQERAGIESAPAPVVLPGQPVPAPVHLVHALHSQTAAPARLVVSRSHTPPWVEAFAREIGGGELLPVGSAGYKVSRLLLGQADLYVHKQGLKEWDTCAPEVLARALGWHVCKLRGESHRYNQPDPKNHELVVCRPSDSGRVLLALERCGVLEGICPP